MKVIKNGEKVEMTYNDICKDLGFIPDVQFVKVTTAGTIGFSAGKPTEIRALFRACNDKGYKPARTLIEARTR